MDEEESLVDEREAKLLTSSRRTGVFLRPVSNPNTTPPHDFEDAPTAVRSPTPAGVHFKGWVGPQRLWGEWLDKLKPTYMGLWRRLGIYEAIAVSTCRIKRDPSSLWGAVGFWCGDTNTFTFPWGEATVTLEDVMVLSGLPVLGDPVRLRAPLTGEMCELETRIGTQLKSLNKTKCKKPDAAAWIRHYLEAGRGDDEEHAAFLALWLSRYVLPSPPEGIVRHTAVHVAVRLAHGVRIALAPAVLASVYRDLRAMKACLRGPPADSPLVVWAPLGVLQLWLWERFSSLRPASEASVGSDEPRAARWSNVGKVMDLSYVNSVLESRAEFRWRPYADHWTAPAFYKDDGEWICDCGVGNEELRSFAMCLRACELLGFSCIEQYLPHRVAMQFGLDQDVPNLVSRVDTSWEAAWETYDISGKNVKFYVSPSRFDSGATLRYSIWWKNTRRNLKRKREGKLMKKNMPQSERQKKIQDLDDDITLSDWLGVKNPSSKKSRSKSMYAIVYQRRRSTKSQKPLLISAAVTNEQHALSTNQAISAFTNSEITNQNSNALKEDGNETQRENLISDVENKEIMGDIEETNVEASVVDYTEIEEVPENFGMDFKNSDTLKKVQLRSGTQPGEKFVSDLSDIENNDIMGYFKKTNADDSMVIEEVPESFEINIENSDAFKEVQVGGENQPGEKHASDLSDIENEEIMGDIEKGNVEPSADNSMIVQEVPENLMDNENSDALQEVQLGGEIQPGEKLASDLSDIENKESMGDSKKGNVEESVDNSMVMEEVPENLMGIENSDALRKVQLGGETQPGEKLASDLLVIENNESMGDSKKGKVEESVDNSMVMEEVPEHVIDIENSVALREVQLGGETQPGEKLASDLSDIENKESMGDSKKGNVEESVDNSMVMEEVPENLMDIQNSDVLREVQLGGETQPGEKLASDLSDIENNESMGDGKKGKVEESVDNSMVMEEVPEYVIDIENSVALREVQLGGETQPGEKLVSDLSDMEKKECMGDIKERNVEESVDDSMVIDEVLENIKMEGMEKIAASKDKSAKLELEIEKLKEEIASIQARVMELESQQTEVHYNQNNFL